MDEDQKLEFLLFIRKLGTWFKEVEKDQKMLVNSHLHHPDDQAMYFVIKALNWTTVQDEELLKKLYKVYKGNLN
jgi:hypothetical protein